MNYQDQIIHGNWWKCETSDGTEYVRIGIVTKDRLQELLTGTLGDIEPIVTTGWGARVWRLNPEIGITPWEVFDKKEEAEEYLKLISKDLSEEEDEEAP